MKIAIKDISEEGLLLEGEVPASHYDLPEEGNQRWGMIEYRLMSNVLGTECLINGNLRVEWTSPCARCLEPFKVKIHVKDFNRSYDLSEGVESIDLTEAIREDILLSLPFAPKCQLDADFRCPMTGQTHREPENKFAEMNRQDTWEALDRLEKKNLKRKRKKE
ncbi:MAG: YceD family protein [Verrucomicrobiota bacterium]